MFHYLVAVREYSSDFSVLSSLTLTFSGPGSPNQSCPRPRLPPAVGGRHLGRETYRSTTAQRADMQPKLQQTPLTRTTHLAGADSPKTQTTSPLAARCQCFSPRWSAVWAPHHRKPRARRHQSGGIALHGGPTRRRHAVRGLLVVQNPHRSRLKCAASPTSPGRSTGWREKVRPARPLRRLFREKVRPARVKTPNLGQFERTGRTFSRFHDLTATQGELFRARRRRPSRALPISDPTQLVWRAPEDPESPAAVPMSSARALP